MGTEKVENVLINFLYIMEGQSLKGGLPKKINLSVQTSAQLSSCKYK